MKIENKFNGHNKKRPDKKGRGDITMEIKISRHYFITNTIHIELIKIATSKGGNLSYHVREALKEYIEKYKIE